MHHSNEPYHPSSPSFITHTSFAMSAQGFTHSCCEDDGNYPVAPEGQVPNSHSLTSLSVSVSPTSLDTLLRDVPNLDASTLQRILGRAIGTIRQT